MINRGNKFITNRRSRIELRTIITTNRSGVCIVMYPWGIIKPDCISSKESSLLYVRIRMTFISIHFDWIESSFFEFSDYRRLIAPSLSHHLSSSDVHTDTVITKFRWFIILWGMSQICAKYGLAYNSVFS